MKTTLKYLYFFSFTMSLFGGCKKVGEVIEVKGYGSINISSTTSSDIGNLLVEIDGKVVDTLKAPSATKEVKTYTGTRNLKIYQPGKANTPVIDTVFHVLDRTNKIRFLYTGDVKIIGGGYDGSVTPSKGSSLVQFVNLDKSLPVLVDMKIYEIYFNDAGDYLYDEVATVENISKTEFGKYVEIPPIKHGDYSFGGYYYGLFNPENNEELVNVSVDFPSIYFDNSTSIFRPNKVLSLGIVKDDGGLFTTTIIYDTQLK